MNVNEKSSQLDQVHTPEIQKKSDSPLAYVFVMFDTGG